MAALKYAVRYPDSIFRGESIPSLPQVATAPLPWTDPDPVLTWLSKPSLFYRVETVESIVLKKHGDSIKILSHPPP
jgi:hypothetical protein